MISCNGVNLIYVAHPSQGNQDQNHQAKVYVATMIVKIKKTTKAKKISSPISVIVVNMRSILIKAVKRISKLVFLMKLNQKSKKLIRMGLMPVAIHIFIASITTNQSMKLSTILLEP